MGFAANARLIVLFAAAVLVAQSQANASCVIFSPIELTANETSQLESRGYEVKVQRHLYKHSRFLGLYEFYEMKPANIVPGQLFLNAVQNTQVSVFNITDGTDITMISKREFRLMQPKPTYVDVIELARSVPPKLARSAEELDNANFAGVAACR